MHHETIKNPEDFFKELNIQLLIQHMRYIHLFIKNVESMAVGVNTFHAYRRVA
jgi:hypothetical protein